MPLGRFSVAAKIPSTLTGAFDWAASWQKPITAAAPDMSCFIAPMPSAGLIEIPPLSKVIPLPTTARVFTFAFTFALGGCERYRMITMQGGWAEPWLTASSPPIPSCWRSSFQNT